MEQVSLPEHDAGNRSVFMHECSPDYELEKWNDRLYYFSLFYSLSVIGRCRMNMNIPSPKLEALQTYPKEQNEDFLEIGSNEIDYISVIYADHHP
jgi:hypothetical protein